MLPASGTTSLSLRQVQEHWEDILRSLRSKKHLATEAVLRSSTCVEVYGVEIVVTPPSQILMDKLSDPQRLAEIQKAMDEVLGVQCQLKFVLAANFRPRSQPSESPRSQPAESPQPQPAVKLPAQAPTPSPEPPARPETNPEMGEGDMDQLRGWVTAVGGQIVEG